MPEASGNRVSVRVPEELHKLARLKRADQHRSFQEVLLKLLEEWVLGKREVTPDPKPLNKWHGILSDILASGDKEAIDAVQRNLILFRRIASSNPGTASNHAAVKVVTRKEA